MPSSQQTLEAFADAAQNPDLLRLESLLTRFNLFEAVGVVRHELRHSDFLAFLLDPSRNHGLGDIFLREVLQTVRPAAPDLDALDLNQSCVFREWHHIDILVVDEVNRFAVIIENKVDTSEHSDQLNRYRQEFDSHYPGYQAVALYLTPDGDEPSSSDYRIVSYTTVCEIIESIALTHRARLDSEIVMVLEHYAQMLRRHIVSDSDVAELCRSIYQKHRQALDLIFEHRPDQQAQVGECARSLIEQDASMKLYGFAKSWINFTLLDWDKSLKFREPSTNQAVFPYLSFNNFSNRLNVGMWIGPGNPRERELVRRKAQETGVTGVAKNLNQRSYSKISSLEILSPRDYQKSRDEIEALILDKWRDFLDDELPKMMQAVREEEWLWGLESFEVIKHRPDHQAQINEYAQRLIKNESSLKPCYHKKAYIQFNPLAWDGSPLYQGVYPMCPWFLYFQFNNEPDNLSIVLIMTPGDQVHREKLFEVAQRNHFQGCPAKFTKLKGPGEWSRLFEKVVLMDTEYEKTQEEIELIMSQKWEGFLHHDLPYITQAIREEEWLWTLPKEHAITTVVVQ